MKTTKIDNRDVEVRASPTTIVSFSGGAGPKEEGNWEFWVAVHGVQGVSARCRAGDDPGERFRRMENALGYERYWDLARKADYLRPALRAELEHWLDCHDEDARFAGAAQVAGKAIRVIKEGGHWLVKE